MRSRFLNFKIFWTLRILRFSIVGFLDLENLGVWDFKNCGFGDVGFSGSLGFGILGLLGS